MPLLLRMHIICSVVSVTSLLWHEVHSVSVIFMCWTVCINNLVMSVTCQAWVHIFLRKTVACLILCSCKLGTSWTEYQISSVLSIQDSHRDTNISSYSSLTAAADDQVRWKVIQKNHMQYWDGWPTSAGIPPRYLNQLPTPTQPPTLSGTANEYRPNVSEGRYGSSICGCTCDDWWVWTDQQIYQWCTQDFRLERVEVPQAPRGGAWRAGIPCPLGEGYWKGAIFWRIMIRLFLTSYCHGR